jgi:prevent-host-death family protein
VPVLQGPTRLGLFYPGRPTNKVIDVHEARRHLSRILKDVAEGAEVVIAMAGIPVARLVPVGTRPRPKQLGLLEGRIEVPDDFDAPLAPQVLADFEGRSSP